MANSFGTDILIQAQDPKNTALFYVKHLGFAITDEKPNLISLHGERTVHFATPKAVPQLNRSARGAELTWVEVDLGAVALDGRAWTSAVLFDARRWKGITSGYRGRSRK